MQFKFGRDDRPAICAVKRRCVCWNEKTKTKPHKTPILLGACHKKDTNNLKPKSVFVPIERCVDNLLSPTNQIRKVSLSPNNVCRTYCFSVYFASSQLTTMKFYWRIGLMFAFTTVAAFLFAHVATHHHQQHSDPLATMTSGSAAVSRTRHVAKTTSASSSTSANPRQYLSPRDLSSSMVCGLCDFEIILDGTCLVIDFHDPPLFDATMGIRDIHPVDSITVKVCSFPNVCVRDDSN